MEIPTPQTGTVVEVKVNVGDKVQEGDAILDLEIIHTYTDKTEQVAPKQIREVAQPNMPTPPTPSSTPIQPFNPSTANIASGVSHASPSIRKLARELGVDLYKVSGSGQKGRVLAADVKAYVKQILTSGHLSSAIPPVPSIDFSEFGDTEIQPLSRINKRSGKHLTACWLNIPHVTQFDEANIE